MPIDKYANKNPCHLFNLRTAKSNIAIKIQRAKKTTYCPLENTDTNTSITTNRIFFTTLEIIFTAFNSLYSKDVIITSFLPDTYVTKIIFLQDYS